MQPKSGQLDPYRKYSNSSEAKNPVIRASVDHPDIQDSYHPTVDAAKAWAVGQGKRVGADSKTRYKVFSDNTAVADYPIR